MSKQKMDIFLRDLLQRIPDRFVELLTGQKGKKILDNTFPSVRERKADLVIELQDGSIFHLELQTYPDKKMPFRMLEYWTLLKQRYPGRKIRQMVLYVGEGAPRMENFIDEDDVSYRYQLRDIKELSCKELMESPKIEDKILAVLCKVEDPERYFSELFRELLKLPEKERADYIRKLLTALHYRNRLKLELERLLEERKVPLTITEEMMKQDPFFQRGQKIGQRKGQEIERQRVVMSLYKKGKKPEEIAELLDISLEEVNSFLQKKDNQK